MSHATNPYLEPLLELYRRLNVYHGLIHLVDQHLRRSRADLERSLKDDWKGNPHAMFTGTCLAMSDLTAADTNDGWPSGKFLVMGTEHLQAIEKMLNRNCARAVADGYEAFETFIQDIVAVRLHVHPTEADPDKHAKFTRKQRHAFTCNSMEFWKAYARRAFRGPNNSDLFSFLRQVAPKLVDAETSNNRGLHLPTWYDAVSEVRHAVTHRDQVIRPQTDFPPIADDCEDFPTVPHERGRLLVLQPPQVETALTYFGEYAYTIFKYLSLADGHAWEWQAIKLHIP